MIEPALRRRRAGRSCGIAGWPNWSEFKSEAEALAGAVTAVRLLGVHHGVHDPDSDPDQHNRQGGCENVLAHAKPVAVVTLGIPFEFGGPVDGTTARGPRLHRSSRSRRNER